MTRNLKVLGLAITAVLAMSAVWAVAAQASLPVLDCTTRGESCTVTSREVAGGEHIFTVEGGNVRCRSSFQATVRLTASGETRTSSNHIPNIVASYNECRAFGVAATVRMEGCEYTFEGQTDNNGLDTANVDVVCPEGRTIVVNAPALPCTVNVPGQKGLVHIVFNNEGSEPTGVLAKITVDRKIKYTKVQATCPRGAGTFETGSYNGESTLEGYEDKTSANRVVEEGAKVGLHVVTPATRR